VCWFHLYHRVAILYLGFISQLSLELSGTHTGMHGIFFHWKPLMLTTELQYRQLLPAVYGNLPHTGSHCTSQTNQIQQHWRATSAGAERGSYSAQTTWIRIVLSKATGVNSISREKCPGMIKGQDEEREF